MYSACSQGGCFNVLKSWAYSLQFCFFIIVKRGMSKSGRHALNSLVGLLKPDDVIVCSFQSILESLNENSKVDDSTAGRQALWYAFDAFRMVASKLGGIDCYALPSHTIQNCRGGADERRLGQEHIPMWASTWFTRILISTLGCTNIYPRKLWNGSKFAWCSLSLEHVYSKGSQNAQLPSVKRVFVILL